MAAKSYVESAAGQLAQALGDIKNQIDQVERDGNQQRQQVEQTIQSLETEKRGREVQFLQVNNNEKKADAQFVRHEVVEIDRQIGEKQAELQRIDQEVAARQQEKQRAADDIQSAVSEVNRALGSPGLV